MMLSKIVTFWLKKKISQVPKVMISNIESRNLKRSLTSENNIRIKNEQSELEESTILKKSVVQLNSKIFKKNSEEMVFKRNNKKNESLINLFNKIDINQNYRSFLREESDLNRKTQYLLKGKRQKKIKSSTNLLNVDIKAESSSARINDRYKTEVVHLNKRSLTKIEKFKFQGKLIVQKSCCFDIIQNNESHSFSRIILNSSSFFKSKKKSNSKSSISSLD